MKTKFFSISLLILTAVFTQAFSSEEIKTRTHTLGEFTGIISNAHANIIIRQGEKSIVKVEGTPWQMESLVLSNEHGALTISGSNTTPVTIYVFMEKVNLIEANGLSKIWVSGTLTSDLLLLKASETGSIQTNVCADKVGAIARGQGRIFLTGSCRESFTRTSGKGKIFSGALFPIDLTEAGILNVRSSCSDIN